MSEKPYTATTDDAGRVTLDIRARGLNVIDNPQLNRGTAFTSAERAQLGITGMLPAAVETLDEQAERAYQQYSGRASDLDKWIFLTQLHDDNEVLYYRVVLDHLEEMLPVVYTPVVGTAIEEFSHLFRRARGVYLNIDDVAGIDAALEATGFGPDDIDLIVASDGEAILGIGDWGAGAIEISVGKLAVYTVAGGIDPRRVLAVGLDVGTNRDELRNDSRYLGLRRTRATGDEYFDFIDAYVKAASRRFPKAILHWEDFSARNARAIVAKYGDDYCTFDDDIQGTASIALACALAGVRVSGGTLTDQQVVVFGAGAAGCGIADLIAHAMIQDGLSPQEAADRIWLLDRPGLLTSDMTDLAEFQQPYAKDPAKVAGWRNGDTLGLAEVVANLHPTMLVGTSGVHGAFTESVIRSMAEHCERPIVLPMSNPTPLAEQTPENLIAWTDGKALVATGSPFGPVDYQGTTYRIGEANNALMFPGLGLGTILAQASTMPEPLFLAAARVIAEQADPTDPTKGLLPAVDRFREVSEDVAVAVITAAQEAGVARATIDDAAATVKAAMWAPEYPTIRS